jgi:hypothetical protein
MLDGVDFAEARQLEDGQREESAAGAQAQGSSVGRSRYARRAPPPDRTDRQRGSGLARPNPAAHARMAATRGPDYDSVYRHQHAPSRGPPVTNVADPYPSAPNGTESLEQPLTTFRSAGRRAPDLLQTRRRTPPEAITT